MSGSAAPALFAASERAVVDVAGHRGDQTDHVGRTAGAPEEGLAVMLPVRLERVHIKVGVPRKRVTGNHSVIQGALHHVGELRLAGGQVHPVRPEGQPDRRARLAVGRAVRQIVLAAEPLVRGVGADPAGDIHLAERDVVPETVHRRHQRVVMVVARHIGRPGVEVHRADRVTEDFGLLAQRHVVLAVVAEKSLFTPLGDAAAVDEEFRLFQVFFVAGILIHFHQRQFQLRMPRHAAQLAFARSVSLADQIEQSPARVQKCLVACRARHCDGAFGHVPCAVELVHVGKVRPFLIRLANNVPAHQITVLLLGGADQIDPLFRLCLDGRVRLFGEGVGKPLNHLVDVGIIEIDPPEIPLGTGGDLKVLNPSGLVFAPVDVMGRRDFSVRPDTGRPETVGGMNVVKGDFLEDAAVFPGLEYCGKKNERRSLDDLLQHR